MLAGALLALVAVLVIGSAAAGQAALPPWKAADAIHESLARAGTDLLFDQQRQAGELVAIARESYRGPLRTGVQAQDPALDRQVLAALDDAETAIEANDDPALASAEDRVWGALVRASFANAITATRAGDIEAASAWLKLRDFRTATRAYRPLPTATLALSDLADGVITAEEAALLVRKDLLDGYQSRMDELLEEASDAAERDFPLRMAETTALASQYWTIIGPEYGRQIGAEQLEQANAEVAALEAAGAAGNTTRTARQARIVDEILSSFQAAPLTDEEQARRASQLLRFVDLVPFEYGKGVNDGRVTISFEIQEARTFLDAARDALDDLTPALNELDPEVAPAVAADLAQLDEWVTGAERQEAELASDGEVNDLAVASLERLEAVYPDEWDRSGDEADFEIIQLTLDRLRAGVSAGEYDVVEQARIEAYALFEFGPERKLIAFDPGLVAEVEGLIWFGWDGTDGLAEQIANRAPPREIAATRAELDDALARSAGTLGEGASNTTIVTNSAVIVFREGLEAVLILAAITASLLGANKKLRAPVLWGGVIALGASAITFVLAQTLLRSLSTFGEKLEAIVGLIAIAVLMLILNWFFHKVYWTRHISGFHGKRKRLLARTAEGGFISAQMIGLVLLGFTSVYREGFETVLFLQALQLSAGTAVVLQGVALGVVAVGAIAVATFMLQKKLPYKKMLVVTGVLIGGVLLSMVGSTVRTMQGVGWVGITPLDVTMPFWAGEWFGVFPTWETIGAQVGALVFVVGSYFLAEQLRDRSRRRARKQAQEALASAGAGPSEVHTSAVVAQEDEPDSTASARGSNPAS